MEKHPRGLEAMIREEVEEKAKETLHNCKLNLVTVLRSNLSAKTDIPITEDLMPDTRKWPITSVPHSVRYEGQSTSSHEEQTKLSEISMNRTLLHK